MAFHLDFSKIPIDSYRRQLLQSYLLPSQRCLREDLEKRFAVIRKSGITTMGELSDALKTKSRVVQYAERTRLPVGYLTVLRRELNSRRPQPRKLLEFTGIDSFVIRRLAKAGIRTAADLYGRVIKKKDRTALAKSLDIDPATMLLLTKLCDFCRIRYVNYTFANLCVHSSYHSVASVQKADPQQLLEALVAMNIGNQFFRGRFGLNDMVFFVQDAKAHPLEIEY